MKASLEKSSEQQYALTGELSFESVPALSRSILPLLKDNTQLDISLDQVKRSDSAGVAMLVEWLRLAQQQQKTLRFLDIPEQMLSIVRVSGLDTILPLSRSR